MMSRWGEEVEGEETLKKERITVGFAWNFISASHTLNRIDEEVGEWDEKYPKSELWKIWGSTLVIMCILLCASYSVVMIATLPFLFFYGSLLFKISKAFKRFGYPRVGYWAATILILVGMVGLSILVRSLLFGGGM